MLHNLERIQLRLLGLVMLWVRGWCSIKNWVAIAQLTHILTINWFERTGTQSKLLLLLLKIIIVFDPCLRLHIFSIIWHLNARWDIVHLILKKVFDFKVVFSLRSNLILRAIRDRNFSFIFHWFSRVAILFRFDSFWRLQNSIFTRFNFLVLNLGTKDFLNFCKTFAAFVTILQWFFKFVIF